MKDTIIFIATVLLMVTFVAWVITDSNKKDRAHREFMDSMTYCERLDYRLERSVFARPSQAIALEKIAAYQAGQCPQK